MKPQPTINKEIVNICEYIGMLLIVTKDGKLYKIKSIGEESTDVQAERLKITFTED